MSSICVDVEDPGQRKECGALKLECIYPSERQGISAHVRTDQRPPEWADASEEVETSTRFEAASVPVGMSSYDPGALSQYQQKRLNQLKVATVDANYKYLADHPELKAMLMLFLDHLLKTRPKDVRASAGEFFRSEKTLARLIRRYFGMQFWKPPAKPSTVTSTPETLSASARSRGEEEVEGEEEEEEESTTSAEGQGTGDTETPDRQGDDATSQDDDEDQQKKAPPEAQNLSGDTQLMMEMAESYDSRLILNLSARRLEEKKQLQSAMMFRKQVSFGGSLLPRTPGWEIDPTVHFFVEDIQPEIAQLYATEKVETVQRKLKFFGNS